MTGKEELIKGLNEDFGGGMGHDHSATTYQAGRPWVCEAQEFREILEKENSRTKSATRNI
jgi:hypothetical protein